MQTRSPLVVIATFLVGLAWFGCPEDSPGPAGEGEGEGEGEAQEGEGEEGEGEGEALAIAYQFERDGVAVPDDTLELGAFDTANGSLTVELALRNLGATEFTILSDPPLLVAGRDASYFSVPTQPPTVVPAQSAVPFTLVYAPTAGGDHEGRLLFAYGVRADERVTLTVRANTEGPAASPGVRYAIYDGDFDALPDFNALGAVETGVIPFFDISARVDTDFFGYTFDGFIVTPDTGQHTFFISSDDGSRLFINGELLIDNDGLHGPQEFNGVVDLAPGAHQIRVEFFEKGGGAFLEVSWQGQSFGREVIPEAVLFTDDPT